MSSCIISILILKNIVGDLLVLQTVRAQTSCNGMSWPKLINSF